MKAIVQERYGSPDEVLALRDVETPSLGENDDRGVLVEVHAASVNALDWHFTRGMPYPIRFGEGIGKPKNALRGVGEFVGEWSRRGVRLLPQHAQEEGRVLGQRPLSG